ncbi:MAG: hypothetical protein K5799_05095 [Erythrobacter sp.]|nr:hypothetical protein [Erythrobacter sp.]
MQGSIAARGKHLAQPVGIVAAKRSVDLSFDFISKLRKATDDEANDSSLIDAIFDGNSRRHV